jgi:hypothetical protein
MAEENSRRIWEEFLGKDPRTLALPDFNSNYFDYSFERTTDAAQHTGLRITGEFPYARYMSFNIYDGDEGASYGALTDFQISPLPDNVNPFVAGSNAQAKNRSYSVTVLPEGHSTGRQENELTFSKTIKVLTVMMRNYVPQGTPYGNVQLPIIEAFDTRTGQSVALPPAYCLRGSIPPEIMAGRLLPIFGTAQDDDTLRFYHARGSGQFNNADSSYLISAIEPGAGQVLLIRIKPPSYPHNNDEFDKTDVRYWSFNEGDPSTSTPFGKKDDEFQIAQDGFVNIAIGDESIRRTAEGRGYNFMPWRAEREKSVILYRSLVTNPQYRGNLDRVPEIKVKDLENKQNLPSKEAKNYIGDYAPTGKKILQALFMLGQ